MPNLANAFKASLPWLKLTRLSEAFLTLAAQTELKIKEMKKDIQDIKNATNDLSAVDLHNIQQAFEKTESSLKQLYLAFRKETTFVKWQMPHNRAKSLSLIDGLPSEIDPRLVKDEQNQLVNPAHVADVDIRRLVGPETCSF